MHPTSTELPTIQEQLDAVIRITNAFDRDYLPQEEGGYTNEIRLHDLTSYELHNLAHDLFYREEVRTWSGKYGYPKELPGFGQFDPRLAPCRYNTAVSERVYNENLGCFRRFIEWAEKCLAADAKVPATQRRLDCDPGKV